MNFEYATTWPVRTISILYMISFSLLVLFYGIDKKNSKNRIWNLLKAIPMIVGVGLSIYLYKKINTDFTINQFLYLLFLLTSIAFLCVAWLKNKYVILKELAVLCFASIGAYPVYLLIGGLYSLVYTIIILFVVAFACWMNRFMVFR